MVPFAKRLSVFWAVLRLTTTISSFCLIVSTPTKVANAQPPPASPGKNGTQNSPQLPPELKKISDLYAKAVKYHTAKQYPEALAAYKEFIVNATSAKIAPGAILAAYSNMAIIYQVTDDRANYKTTLLLITGMDPKNARVLAQLAILESTDRHYDAAFSYSNKALALNPTKDIASSVRFVKGSVAVSHKDFKLAAKEYGESARLTPKNSLSKFNYALALAELSRYDEAKKQMDGAYALDPTNPRIKDYRTKLNEYIASKAAIPKPGVGQVAPTKFDGDLKKNPKDAAALLGRAQQLEQMGRTGDAISAYMAVFTVNPESFDAHYNLAHLYEMGHNYVASKQHFKIAQQSAEKFKVKLNVAKALHGLAGAEMAEGMTLLDYRQRVDNLKLAETHVKQALEITPKQAAVRILLARIYEAQGRFKEAEIVYRDMLITTPDDVDVYTRLAMTFKSRQDVEGFVKAWKEYQAHKPEDPTSYEYIADVYNQTGKYDKAADSVRELLKRKLSNSVVAMARVFLGQDLSQMNKYDEAKAEFKIALDLKPSVVPAALSMQEKASLEAEQRSALKGLAAICSKELKYDEAIGYLNDLKARDAEVAKIHQQPQTGDTYKDIAVLYERSNRPDLAILEYRQMCIIVPKDPMPHRELGRVYEAQKKFDLAGDEYTKASVLTPGEPVPDKLKIAEMYQRNNNLDKAQKSLEDLYALNLKNIQVMTQLAEVYRLQKLEVKALSVYDAMIKVDPTLAWVQDHRAESLIRLKRYAEAEDIYGQEIARNPQAGAASYASLRHVFELEEHPEKFMAFMKPRFEKTPANSTAMMIIYDDYLRTGKEADGQTYIMTVIDKLKNTRRICLEIYAHILQSHKHNPESLEIFRQIAAQNAKDLSAWMNLADELDYNQKVEEANQIYLDQIARPELPLDQKANLQRRIAMRFASQKKYPEARAAFQSIFDKRPADYDAAMRLGDIVEKQGNMAEATAFYISLVPLKYPEIAQIDIHNRLGAIYANQKKFPDALLQFKETLKIDPANSIALKAVKVLQGT